jgi:Ca-activated chloride channel homolog
VWARRKIADAEIARTLRQTSPEDADKTILALALEHQLVTRLTSLVAVDKTPSRPDGETLKLSELPLNLPAGWDFEKVFGPRSREQQPADPANVPVERRADATDAKDGRVQLAKADVAKLQTVMVRRPVIVPAAQAQGVMLPKTATDAELKMIAGALLAAAAMLLLALRRRRSVAA